MSNPADFPDLSDADNERMKEMADALRATWERALTKHSSPEDAYAAVLAGLDDLRERASSESCLGMLIDGSKDVIGIHYETEKRIQEHLAHP